MLQLEITEFFLTNLLKIQRDARLVDAESSVTSGPSRNIQVAGHTIAFKH